MSITVVFLKWNKEQLELFLVSDDMDGEDWFSNLSEIAENRQLTDHTVQDSMEYFLVVFLQWKCYQNSFTVLVEKCFQNF